MTQKVDHGELTALSERIRDAAKWAADENDHFEPELGVQAADAIDSILAENEALRAALEYARDHCSYSDNTGEIIRAALKDNTHA